MFVRQTTNEKGAIAEMEIATAAMRLGVTVLRPMAEHGRYDLAFEIGPRVLRVQCKWAALARDGSFVSIRWCGSRLTPNGYVLSPYGVDEIDLLAAYCGDLDRAFLLPTSLVAERRAMHLRLSAPRNAQRACINLASDYDFAGAVAQLGERPAGSRKGRGSSPLSSTRSAPTRHEVGANAFRDHFGYYAERAAAGEEVRVRRHGRPYVRLLPAEEPAATAPP